MSVTGVELVGEDRLAYTIKRAGRRLDDEVGDANREVTQYVQSRARVLAPVRTGRLMSSITTGSDSEIGEVGTPLVYGAVQEFGWPGHGIRAQRYLARAAGQARARATASYINAARESVRGIKGV